jgi:para-aminobenzoate synthetase component I
MSSIGLHNTSAAFIAKALPWLESRYETISYLNPNNYDEYPRKPFRHLLAFGAEVQVEVQDDQTVFKVWNLLRSKYPKEWLFVFISYDAKNSVEQLESIQPKAINSKAATFFIPEHVWELTADSIHILKGEGSRLIDEIQRATAASTAASHAPLEIKPLISKQTYIERIGQLQTLIRKGDAYEINYCIPFTGKGKIEPAETYLRLNTLAPMPFSVFSKWNDFFILSASPERFIKKEKETIISQPIKGTSKRGNNRTEDLELIKELSQSEKEQSENTMIVDLVRNDLSRTAQAGSVHVSEFRGLYTFPHVHQMISTIESKAGDDFSAIDVIQHSFPMGSMTGAPKVKVMQIIDQYETVSRGPFSGTVGYMDPENNFDFNVLIRSIFYNSCDKNIFMEAGSAITYYADAAAEYEECLLKINPMIQILAN